MGEEAQYRVGRGGDVIGPDDELGAIASGQDDHLFDALRAHQLVQRLVAAGLGDPEPFADSHRRSPKIQPDYCQCRFHSDLSRKKGYTE